MVAGTDKKTKMLFPKFEEYIKLIEHEEGKIYSPKTVARYGHALSHIKDYLKLNFNQDDVVLDKLDLMFIRTFDINLQKECDIIPIL